VNRDEQLALVGRAARAPSVHNIQPARWRFVDAGGLHLYRALDRALPVADPSGRDVRLSLGAAFEGMALALSERGLRLASPTFASPTPASPTAASPSRAVGTDADTPAGHEHVASAALLPARQADALAGWVPARRAYRGRFPPAGAGELQALRTAVAAAPDVRLLLERRAIEEVARRYDRASYGFLSRDPWLREFHGWCRFRRSHPDWSRDGLNADALALSALERSAASLLLRPAVFGWLKTLRVARHLVSEAAQIRSSSAILLFCPAREASDFEVGRRFYRLWLELTSAAFCLCPLSAIVDDAGEARDLGQLGGIPADRRLVNAFRLGPVRGLAIAESPRLPAEELLV
jgi:hypothetical protein